MSEPSIEVLAERLGRLERECRRWRLLGGVGGAALAIMLLAGGVREAAEAGPRRVGRLTVDELEARRIVLKDEAEETWFKLERRDGVALMSMLGEGVARLRPRPEGQIDDQRPQPQGGLAPVRPRPAQMLFVINRGAVP